MLVSNYSCYTETRVGDIDFLKNTPYFWALPPPPNSTGYKTVCGIAKSYEKIENTCLLMKQ